MNTILSELTSKHNLYQFIKSGIIGSIGAVINLLVLYVLTEYLYVYYLISETIAFIVASIHNYFLNKIWTFKEAIKDRIVSKYIQFLIINIIGLMINLLVLFILVEHFHFWYIIAEIGATLCAFAFNFLGNKFWTFQEKNEQI
ncbi:MAG: GtrA family protein [Promethearchaeota archaeon]